MMKKQISGSAGRAITDAVDLESNTQQQISMSQVMNQSPRLDEGVYDVWCDQEAYIGVGPDESGILTPATGYKLLAGNIVPLIVRDQSRIAGVLDIGVTAGTLCYHRIM